ncbi:uncharacterized protein LOC124441791 [Xenia sp. Carnegie-2017]|uniref:uncharacterized protein LOC124441791 n=1 Tax=Xenia sp. Carnegie-2017 TaxID=2897299 RepID=UPI001F04A371|nr:uncharacterized protein LOC124441791 [Xenia sp. Carnegie-2017]
MKNISTPSTSSRLTTKVFYQIGQRPSISVISGHENDKIDIIREDIQFNVNHSFWTVSLTVGSIRLLKIKLEASNLAFMDCFIKEAFFQLPSTNWSLSSFNTKEILGMIIQQHKTYMCDNTTNLMNEQLNMKNGSDCMYQVFPPDSSSKIFWNSTHLFLKNSNGDPAILIKKEGDLSSSNEDIRRVTISNNGDYLVLYEDNVTYYGRYGVTIMTNLNSNFPQHSQMEFVFDVIGSAYVVFRNSSGKAISITNYPLDNKVFNSLYPNVNCSFIEFSFGNLSSSNVMDKWGEFKIYGYLVFKRSFLNGIRLVWNPSDDLLLTITEQREYHQDLIILYKTYTFKEKWTNNDTLSLSSYSVTLLPKLKSVICKRPFYKVFRFQIGCPPRRRAFIRDTKHHSSSAQVFEEEDEFSLNLSWGETFQPVLLTYDDKVLIGRYYKHFNIKEVNERSDFFVQIIDKLGNRSTTVFSFHGSGLFRFSIKFEDKNVSFCSTMLQFNVHVTKQQKTNYFLVVLTCVILITTLLITYLVFNYILYRNDFLRRHEEDNETKKRLQELRFLATLQYFNSNSIVQKASKSTDDYSTRNSVLILGKTEHKNN